MGDFTCVSDTYPIVEHVRRVFLVVVLVLDVLPTLVISANVCVCVCGWLVLIVMVIASDLGDGNCRVHGGGRGGGCGGGRGAGCGGGRRACVYFRFRAHVTTASERTAIDAFFAGLTK